MNLSQKWTSDAECGLRAPTGPAPPPLDVNLTKNFPTWRSKRNHTDVLDFPNLPIPDPKIDFHVAGVVLSVKWHLVGGKMGEEAIHERWLPVATNNRTHHDPMRTPAGLIWWAMEWCYHAVRCKTTRSHYFLPFLGVRNCILAVTITHSKRR